MLLPLPKIKHIYVKIHFVREALSNSSIELIYCPTEQMVADLLTKPICISRDRFDDSLEITKSYEEPANLSGSVGGVN